MILWEYISRSLYYYSAWRHSVRSICSRTLLFASATHAFSLYTPYEERSVKISYIKSQKSLPVSYRFARVYTISTTGLMTQFDDVRETPLAVCCTRCRVCVRRNHVLHPKTKIRRVAWRLAFTPRRVVDENICRGYSEIAIRTYGPWRRGIIAVNDTLRAEPVAASANKRT